jgi:hypothetical protein
MSMFTVRGTGPLDLSRLALAIGGSPVAPPRRTTVVGLVERFSSWSMPVVENRYTPALLSWMLVVELVKQHTPLAPFFCPIQRSFKTVPPSGSVAGKLTEAVTGKIEGSVVVTVNVTEGGRPGLGAGETVT